MGRGEWGRREGDTQTDGQVETHRRTDRGAGQDRPTDRPTDRQLIPSELKYLKGTYENKGGQGWGSEVGKGGEEGRWGRKVGKEGGEGR